MFKLIKPVTDELCCNWLLIVEIHKLESKKLDAENLAFPIWVFWYRPTDEAIAQAAIYLQNSQFSHNVKRGMVFYLQVTPGDSSPKSEIEYFAGERLWLCQLPAPIAGKGFSSTVKLMAHLIKRVVEYPL